MVDATAHRRTESHSGVAVQSRLRGAAEFDVRKMLDVALGLLYETGLPWGQSLPCVLTRALVVGS